VQYAATKISGPSLKASFRLIPIGSKRLTTSVSNDYKRIMCRGL
jgi:hypothetical protein